MNKNTYPNRCRVMIPAVMAVIGLAMGAAASADDAADSAAALANCVGTHLTAADNQTVIAMLLVVLIDAQPSESNLHPILADRRDGIIGDTAKLMTRIAETDCKGEVQAANTSKAGRSFGLLFQQLIARSIGSLQTGGQHAAAVFTIDLMKKFDSSVAADLLGSGAGAAAAASSPKPADPAKK